MQAARTKWTDERLDDQAKALAAAFGRIDQRFNGVDARFDRLEDKLDGLRRLMIELFAGGLFTLVAAILATRA